MNFIDGDSLHATEVDGTFPEVTGRAGDGVFDDLALTEGTDSDLVC